MPSQRHSRHLVVSPACLIARQSADLVAIDDPVVSAAMRFIREHAAGRIRVPDVVRHVKVSRSTLETRFKRYLRRTVHDEIQQVRLQMARRLLVSSNLSIDAVAEQAGCSTFQ